MAKTTGPGGVVWGWPEGTDHWGTENDNNLQILDALKVDMDDLTSPNLWEYLYQRDGIMTHIGDSILAGSLTSPTYKPLGSWAYRVRESMPVKYSTYMDFAMALPPSNNVSDAADGRWTLPSGWIRVPFGPANLSSVQSAAGSAAATFTPGVLCDAFDVFFLVLNGSARTLTITATGGASVAIPAYVSTDGGKRIAKARVACAIPTTTNSVTMAWTGGGGQIVGVEPINTQRKSVRIRSLGVQGAALYGAWDTEASSPYGSLSSLQMLMGDVLVISLGTNDAGSVSPANFVAGFETILARARGICRRIIWTTPPPRNDAYDANVKAYITAIRNTYGDEIEICDFHNEVFDGVYSAGLFADNVHPNDAGHTAMAAYWYTFTSSLKVPG